ncbi:MAG: hypothetical protein U0Y82_16650 [Thermoleophilia bacterium]
MSSSDVLKIALAAFLVITGVGLGYLFFRMAGVFQRLTLTLGAVTQEMVPILGKAQITMDGVNQQMGHVDAIMVTAVNAAKGAEKSVTTVSAAAVAPVRGVAALAAGVKEGWATFMARRRADAHDSATASTGRHAVPYPNARAGGEV